MRPWTASWSHHAAQMSQAPGGDDDPVVGCAVGVAEGTVRAAHLDGRIAGTRKAGGGAVGEVLVEFDGDDRAVGPGELGE